MGDDYYMVATVGWKVRISIEKNISHILWLKMLSFKSKVKSKEHGSPDIELLHEEVKTLMLNDDRFKSLNGLSVSLSVFLRESGKVVSGHFGPSRPLVMGGKNEVLPADEVMMKLANGRVIRFWKVISQSPMNSIYVLPHDSNKLDNINLGLLSQKGFFDSDLEEKQILLSDAMSYVHADITAPRYYFGGDKEEKRREQ